MGNRLLLVLFFAVLFSPACKKSPPAESTKTLPVEDFQSNDSKKNAELLQEVMQVVLLQKISDKREFLNLVSVLNQGGSLIGVYNTLAHSQTYRSLEQSHPNSTEAALTAFAQELFEIQKRVSDPTHYEKIDREPLAQPQFPTGEVEVVDFSKNGKKPDRQTEAQLKELFQGASAFTLKRVLGDELLRLIDQLTKNELDHWYGQWTSRFSKYSIPLGLKERNETNAQFHENWAKKSSKEQVSWEALNRIHRVLNELSRAKEK